MILSQSLQTTQLLLNSVQNLEFSDNCRFHNTGRGKIFSSFQKYLSCKGRTMNFDNKN